jgi:broad specificity phosphatase PhoE
MEAVVKRQTVLFITHADVVVDPDVPVQQWGLSARGVQRHQDFNKFGPVGSVTSIYCSSETKAVEAAQILASSLDIPPRVMPDLHENDRSATGFLPPAEFEATADQFFAHPDESIRGWERAIDAQNRIVNTLHNIVLHDTTSGDIAVVAHGGVGALLLCHILGVPISRVHDQPGRGGGNYFVFDRTTWSLLHGWRDIGTTAGVPSTRNTAG